MFEKMLLKLSCFLRSIHRMRTDLQRKIRKVCFWHISQKCIEFLF